MSPRRVIASGVISGYHIFRVTGAESLGLHSKVCNARSRTTILVVMFYGDCFVAFSGGKCIM